MRKVAGEQPMTPRPRFPQAQPSPAEPEPKRARVPRPVSEHQVLLCADQVAVMLGRSTSKFYELLRRDPTFPKAVRLTPTSTPQWIRSEVAGWILLLPRVDALAEPA